MIDNEILGTLQEAMDDYFPELVGVFIKDSESLLDNLPGSVAAGNSKEVSRMAHSLKSTSANFGMMGFSEICSNLEDQADNGDLSTADSQIEELQEIFVHARKQLLAMID